MSECSDAGLVQRRFLEIHGARIVPSFASYRHVGLAEAPRAALGYRRAATGPLFLERYLDAPVEHLVSVALDRPTGRNGIIEIGNLAADDAFAMIELWGNVANDLGAEHEVAVATLTAPLRAMFGRIGVPLALLGPASIARSDDPAAWGRYYRNDPWVCAGVIAEGQSAISAFLARRRRHAA